MRAICAAGEFVRGREVAMRFALKTIFVVLILSFATPAVAASSAWPSTRWERLDPATLGWSAEKLSEAHDYARGYAPTAVMIVQEGKIVAAWGDIAHKVNVRSIRKSLLSALYGIGVAKGQIALDRTLASLGIDDLAPSLSALEKQATIRDLLMARSGVYHPAAYEAPGQALQRPARGSHPPGSFWYYNNWDFNTLGIIYARLTGHDVFESVEERIAKPIGMEDFTAADGKNVFEPVSDYPAYTMRLTARDLARFGWLYLNRGVWLGEQIVPAAWVDESTHAWSETRGPLGYGYLWWVMPPDLLGGAKASQSGGFLALGFGGQELAVLPTRRLVVVQLIDVPEGQERVGAPRFFQLLRLILAAAPGG
jgi:CubicO group peptidase (beta-lactamase class C family)